MRANIELQNKWTLLRIVLNFDRKLPYYWDSLSRCTGGTHLHCHLRGTEEAATLSAPVMLSCRLSSEKQLHFDSPSISALGQLAPTYADVGNQSWSLEGRATVSKGHIQQLQLLSSRSIKGISLGSAWALLASLEEGIIESISLAVGKSNRRADIFKNCHVCQTNLGKMENYAISNFSQICHCFRLKANLTPLSFLAHTDFWQKITAFHLSTYSERSLIPMVLSCMAIDWQFPYLFFFFFRTYTPYISIFIIPCKIIQTYSWIVEIPSLNSYVNVHTKAPHLRSTTFQEFLFTL